MKSSIDKNVKASNQTENILIFSLYLPITSIKIISISQAKKSENIEEKRGLKKESLRNGEG